jgi:16S rRNA (cytidine1402-2'-O)-methyltransferase
MISFHEHNRRQRLPELLAALAEGDLALVSDAGTPLISDPGSDLVAAAAAAGFEVVPIPGPAAPLAALMVSGLDTAVFHFVGFLPRRSGPRRRAIEVIAAWPGSVVLFEAPHRLRATLADLLAVVGDRPVAICGELTKLFEQVVRTTLAAAVERYQAETPRGEYTLVLAGTAVGLSPVDQPTPAPDEPAGSTDLPRRFAALAAELGDRKQALAQLARETGLPRKELYRQLMARKETGGHARSADLSRSADPSPSEAREP